MSTMYLMLVIIKFDLFHNLHKLEIRLNYANRFLVKDINNYFEVVTKGILNIEEIFYMFYDFKGSKMETIPFWLIVELMIGVRCILTFIDDFSRSTWVSHER